MIERSSGVLMAMSSLPSPYGIGTMGKSARRFVDFLSAAGQKYWQLLPLGPTSYGDSPYQSFSTFAGNPYLIDLDLLIRDGLLRPSEVRSRDWGSDPKRVDYAKIYENRFPVLRLAWERGAARWEKEMETFRKETPWLENYALFMAIKASQGMRAWTEWPEELKLRRPEAIAAAKRDLRDDVSFYEFLQFLFFRQWEDLRAYAKEKGVSFIGDVPIYVALDSADVWSEPRFFQLNEKNVPVEVSGCPPDAFNDDGQLWGNPLYDWDAMKRDGYGWWIRRIDGAKKLYDVIRIDHFRGFESYWAVPFGDATAKNGAWKPGPGMGLVGVLNSWFSDLDFIAEDLGYTTPEVRKLLKDSGLPGMKVLQFAFDAHGDSDYLPHNIVENSSCYIGTHDNEPVQGWLKWADRPSIRYAGRYMHITSDEGWNWGMIRTGMGTSSRLFVVQMQDLLGLGHDARMNTPGIASGNWQWRMLPDAIEKDLSRKLRSYTETYRRCAVAKKEAAKKEAEKKEA